MFLFNFNMDRAEIVYKKLMDNFGFKDATGEISARLKDFTIRVEQNNIVGNVLEEWLAKWMVANGIPHIHNHKQASPDFWLNPDDKNSDWLEIKSFAGSPGFDIANYRSFIQLIIDKPMKLQSSYLLIKYKMKEGIITIEDFWLKKVWEICCTSAKWALRVQDKKGVITNIRPATWYSDDVDYKPFKSMEHFLAALEETIYRYHDTRHLADNWERRLIESYKNFYGEVLEIPRWMDIKHEYLPKEE